MEFGTLNRHLIAEIYSVNREGVPTGGVTIKAPVTDSNLEVSLSWQSPFEAKGPEATHPALMAMVQSGEGADLLSAAGGAVKGAADFMGAGSALSSATSSLSGLASSMGLDVGSLLTQSQGRTGLTKMNSTQVFTGMPPIKINITLLFRAWNDAKSEVESPFSQLMQWALPQCLQKDSLLTGAIKAVTGASTSCASGAFGTGFVPGALAALLPSQAPQMVGLTYKGRTYSPLVIENVGMPMNSPITADGNYIELLVPLSMSTLSALDAKDWKAIK